MDPELIDPSGGWRPIRAQGVVVELELASPPRHVLEGAGIDAATEPSSVEQVIGGDGSMDFSLATAAGRSSRGRRSSRPSPTRRPTSRGYAPWARATSAIALSPTTRTRACARPLALDGRPLVGAMPGIGGLFIAAGHGPWGLSTGAASGRHVAGLVLGRADAVPKAIRQALDPGQFGPIPG